ncbi:MAG: hypothetical protein EOP04_21250, partial [Proteobacteria bacterium]
NQMVNFVKTTAGFNTIRFNHSKKCMDVSGGSTAENQLIWQWDCANVPNQEWMLKPTP